MPRVAGAPRVEEIPGSQLPIFCISIANAIVPAHAVPTPDTPSCVPVWEFPSTTVTSFWGLGVLNKIQQTVFSHGSGWQVNPVQKGFKRATLSLDSLPASGGPRHSLCYDIPTPISSSLLWTFSYLFRSLLDTIPIRTLDHIGEPINLCTMILFANELEFWGARHRDSSYIFGENDPVHRSLTTVIFVTEQALYTFWGTTGKGNALLNICWCSEYADRAVLGALSCDLICKTEGLRSKTWR